MRRACVLLIGLLLTSCSRAGAITVQDENEMTGNFSEEVSSVLFVDPETVEERQEEFVAKLKVLGPNGQNKRDLYERYLATLGANGELDGITQLWPTCHSEAHDLGKVIYSHVKDVGTALQVCRDGCYSGCMHGVLMEAFAGARASDDPEGHVDLELVKGKMDEICTKNSTMLSAYSPGDCAHAVGHALMVLADYRVTPAIQYCDEFSTDHMRYYCATGAYMEYVTERDAEDVKAGRRALYPCDVGEYPAACARYKMVHVTQRLVKKKSDVPGFMRSCEQLTGKYRLGCYHGAGNAFMGIIVQKQLTIDDVCTATDADARYVCIEGVIERMAKYHPSMAVETCRTLSGTDRETCDAAAKHGMYNMEKDIQLYVL